MNKTGEVWLCPACETNARSCRICDGSGFLTNLEFLHYEASKLPKQANKLSNSCNEKQTLLTLDLSEFESEK